MGSEKYEVNYCTVLTRTKARTRAIMEENEASLIAKRRVFPLDLGPL